tara:strand:- start:950 stop:1708 length:759 start_codon:yes stop_codon:yes gene_type:complete
LKTIWITGGSSGIGLAVARKFLLRNWRVVISSKNIDNLNNAKKNIIEKSQNKEIYAIKCDISDRKEVNDTLNKIEKEISKIDIALLNAAAYSPNKDQSFNIENYELLIDVNIKGTIYCIEALQKIMNGRGNHIAIVSSPVGYRGLPTAGAYGLTKAALINLAESLFFDFKKNNIKISIINPGFIESRSTNLNTFPMPFLKSSDYAANKIFLGLTKSYKFEIYFPYFFLLIMKIARILPYKIYFYLIKKITGL